MINRIMKDNGAVPAFVSLSQELAKLRQELLETADRTERRRVMQDISLLEAKIEIARKAG